MGKNGYAMINDAECIRCGHCHEICPRDAVRHDRERIPLEVADNLRWVGNLLTHYSQPAEQAAFMQRMIRHFTKEEEIARRTIAMIMAAENDPAGQIKAAADSLSER